MKITGFEGKPEARVYALLNHGIERPEVDEYFKLHGLVNYRYSRMIQKYLSEGYILDRYRGYASLVNPSTGDEVTIRHKNHERTATPGVWVNRIEIGATVHDEYTLTDVYTEYFVYVGMTKVREMFFEHEHRAIIMRLKISLRRDGKRWNPTVRWRRDKASINRIWKMLRAAKLIGRDSYGYRQWCAVRKKDIISVCVSDGSIWLETDTQNASYGIKWVQTSKIRNLNRPVPVELC